ncbi:hypothetical protein B0H16DRAFT_1904056 [Mycena metata]|uniref:Uncharacterized protein n=1 Tax=Mycena metata TaxID=1033252 RepID=A0AAD7DNJ3_9AGAR|nr:hypothetical protein B0H16DRAFT_1904056 [Mycena metata]
MDTHKLRTKRNSKSRHRFRCTPPLHSRLCRPHTNTTNSSPRAFAARCADAQASDLCAAVVPLRARKRATFVSHARRQSVQTPGEGGVPFVLPKLYNGGSATGPSMTPTSIGRRAISPSTRACVSPNSPPRGARASLVHAHAPPPPLRARTPTTQRTRAHPSPPNPPLTSKPTTRPSATAHHPSNGGGCLIVSRVHNAVSSSLTYPLSRNSIDLGVRPPTTTPNTEERSKNRSSTSRLSSHHVLEEHGDAREQARVDRERGRDLAAFGACGCCRGRCTALTEGDLLGGSEGGREVGGEGGLERERKTAQVYVRITRHVALIMLRPESSSRTRPRLLGATRPACPRSARLKYTLRQRSLSLGSPKEAQACGVYGSVRELLAQVDEEYASTRREQDESGIGFIAWAFLVADGVPWASVRLRCAVASSSVELILPVRLRGPLRSPRANIVYSAVVYSLAIAPISCTAPSSTHSLGPDPRLAMGAKAYDVYYLKGSMYGLYMWWAMIRKRDIRGRQGCIKLPLFSLFGIGRHRGVGGLAVGVVATLYTRFFSGNAFVNVITGILFQSKCLPGSGMAGC